MGRAPVLARETRFHHVKDLRAIIPRRAREEAEIRRFFRGVLGWSSPLRVRWHSRLRGLLGRKKDEPPVALGRAGGSNGLEGSGADSAPVEAGRAGASTRTLLVGGGRRTPLGGGKYRWPLLISVPLDGSGVRSAGPLPAVDPRDLAFQRMARSKRRGMHAALGPADRPGQQTDEKSGDSSARIFSWSSPLEPPLAGGYLEKKKSEPPVCFAASGRLERRGADSAPG